MIRHPLPPPPPLPLPRPRPCDYYDDDDDDDDDEVYVSNYPKYSEADYSDDDCDSEQKCYKTFVVEEQASCPSILKPYKPLRPMKPGYNQYPKPYYKKPSGKSDGKSSFKSYKSSRKPDYGKQAPGKTVTVVVDDNDGCDCDYNQNYKKYNEKDIVNDEYRKPCKPPCFPCMTYPYTPSTPITYHYPYSAVINPCPDVSCY